jgi:D-alanine transaminase
MPELACVNGVFSSIADARVSIEDRGFQFGDGVYEVVAAYNRRPFLLDRHMRRLRTSLDAIALPYDFDASPLEPILLEGLRRSEFADALIYIQITRGAAPRSHVIPKGIRPTVVMTFKPLPAVPDDLRRRGAHLMTTPDTRWANCYVKAITLLPNILAKNGALHRGFDDAVFVSAAGEVRECTSANIFMVREDAVIIPPLTESILHGVTQGFLRECAAAVGLPMVEESFTADALRRADEVFISSTATEVLAVTRLDGQPIGDGTVGPRTQLLFNEFRTRSRS